MKIGCLGCYIDQQQSGHNSTPAIGAGHTAIGGELRVVYLNLVLNAVDNTDAKTNEEDKQVKRDALLRSAPQ